MLNNYIIIFTYFILIIYCYFLYSKNKQLLFFKNTFSSNFLIKQKQAQDIINSLETKLFDSQNEIIDFKLKISDLNSNIQLLKASHKEEIVKTRKDTLNKSRSVLRGQASEHLAPFVIKNTNPKDYRFMGNPVDYICFEGLSDIIDGNKDEIISVKFIDIKTGKSKLTKTQRRIRDAINSGKITFEVINLDEIFEKDKELK